jgi:hypothetical protein
LEGAGEAGVGEVRVGGEEVVGFAVWEEGLGRIVVVACWQDGKDGVALSLRFVDLQAQVELRNALGLGQKRVDVEPEVVVGGELAKSEPVLPQVHDEGRLSFWVRVEGSHVGGVPPNESARVISLNIQ